jgi:hypothetical protein
MLEGAEGRLGKHLHHSCGRDTVPRLPFVCGSMLHAAQKHPSVDRVLHHAAIDGLMRQLAKKHADTYKDNEYAPGKSHTSSVKYT